MLVSFFKVRILKWCSSVKISYWLKSWWQISLKNNKKVWQSLPELSRFNQDNEFKHVVVTSKLILPEVTWFLRIGGQIGNSALAAKNFFGQIGRIQFFQFSVPRTKNVDKLKVFLRKNQQKNSYFHLRLSDSATILNQSSF